MGLHYGVLSVKAPLENVIVKLSSLNVNFDKKEDLQQYPEETLLEEGWIILASEIDNYSIIMDSSFVLSGSQNPDLIIELSRYFKDPIVSCGAETVSGSFWFLSAYSNHILRFYEHCHMEISKPFSIGDSLPSEAILPFNGDLYGNGLFDGLKYYGYDFRKWFNQFPKSSYFYKIDNYYTPDQSNNSISLLLKKHHDKYKIPLNKRPEIKIVSQVVDNEAHFNIASSEVKKKKSISDRFRNIFK